MRISKVLAFLCKPYLVLCIAFALAACGGGSGAAGNNPTPGAVSVAQGQVIKGLAAGSQVSVYTMSTNGQRALIGTALTDTAGAFVLPAGVSLVVGQVYLFEAIGGNYINEITGLTEQLSAPMRAVFVATSPSPKVSISPISEMVAVAVERSLQTNPWGSEAIARAEVTISSLFGIPSSFGLRYTDLAKLNTEQLASLAEDDFAFSFQLGIFAGYLEELKRRNRATLASAFQSFYAQMVGSADQSQDSVHASGLIRYVESVPGFANFSFKAQVYAAYGLPSDASLSAFEGAESSGGATEPIPNFRLRHLSPPFFTSSPTNDTVFDVRGALIAHRQGNIDSGVGFTHVGVASVADVYGNRETAIGRWNRGYFYRAGVGLNAQRTAFEFPDQIRSERLQRDTVYAAGTPAENLPTCGSTTLGLRAQTQHLIAFDGSFRLRLDASSKLTYRFTLSGLYVSYDLVLVDEQGRSYRIASPGTGDPLQGAFLSGSAREAGSFDGLVLPSGETISMRLLVAGDQARKGVIVIESNIIDPRGRGIAAAFEQTGTGLACSPVQLSPGIVNPVPQTGDYLFGLAFVQQLEFFDNGTPKLPGMSGVTANSGLSKAGNELAGIGLLASSFEPGTNRPVNLSAYGYRKTDISPPPMPRSGSATYRLIASTPLVVSTESELLDIEAPAATATLTVYFNGEPVSPASPYYGLCHLTIDGGPVVAASYFQDGGGCDMNSGISNFGEEYSGGITAEANQYAVIVYTKHLSSTVKKQIALLFEKAP